MFIVMVKGRKVQNVVLWIIGTITSVEILVFFAFTFFESPDRITNYKFDIPHALPKFSELFTPFDLRDYITLEEQDKKFYPQKLTSFSQFLQPIFNSNSSFVKEVEASYVVAGEVVKVNRSVSGYSKEVNEYEVIVENIYGRKYSEKINLLEIKEVNVWIRQVAEGSFVRSQGSLDDLQIGDYFVLRKKTNLLDSEDQTSVEVEILRT
jgi:hypothetical protein